MTKQKNDNPEIPEKSHIDTSHTIEPKQFRITTIISILTIFATMGAAFFGVYLSIQFQNSNNEQTTAKIIYDDLDRMNYTIQNYFNTIQSCKNNKGIPYLITPIYPSNGIYYAVRSNIVLMKPSLARNISIFYSDLEWAETYRLGINKQIESSNKIIINNSSVGMLITSEQAPILNPSLNQLQVSIEDAHLRRSQIMSELENTYNIQKNPRNAYNYF